MVKDVLSVKEVAEFAEFSRNVLEVLRQPLEDRAVTISRARAVHTFSSTLYVMRIYESLSLWLSWKPSS